ncbi:hypothetical protein [Microcoleus sp. FACHB-672]|nr:hypothetical protein [Microcoleus sp. FACHB-672]MBD2043871.1 hypothetical protein [Microcoleus sp. FACHB-672]
MKVLACCFGAAGSLYKKPILVVSLPSPPLPPQPADSQKVEGEVHGEL